MPAASTGADVRNNAAGAAADLKVLRKYAKSVYDIAIACAQ